MAAGRRPGGRRRRRPARRRRLGALIVRADRCARCTGWRPPPAGSPSCRWTGARWPCRYGCPPPTPTRAPRSGRSGAALNRMLGHVADALAARQASETRVRQFVADASHELRTPLAAIRGYAGAGPARPGPGAAGRGPRAAPGRVRERPDDHASSTTCCCWPGSTPAAAGRRAGRPDRAGGGRGQRRPRGRPRTPVAARPARRGGGRCRATPPGCTRCWRTCWPTPGCTPRPARTVTTRLAPVPTARS